MAKIAGNKTKRRAASDARTGGDATRITNEYVVGGDLAVASVAMQSEPTGERGPLRSASARGQAEASAGLQGRIERLNESGIAGWVWNPNVPEKRIRLELVDGATCLKTAIADDERPDLVHLGCGDGRHGFAIEVEEGLLSEGQHSLILRCADTGEEVPGSPITLPRVSATIEQALQTRTPFRYYVDEVSDSGIVGWIMMPEQPSNRYVVTLKQDGRVVTKTVASRFRADLLAAGVGDGCYCFEFALPRASGNGLEHVLEIVEEASGTSLTEGPVRWHPRPDAGVVEQPIARTRHQPESRAPSARVDWGGERALPGRNATSYAAQHGATQQVGTRILFDVSDLVYYIGHHPNLTGIQRVQSSIVLSMFEGDVLSPSAVTFLSFNAITRNWVVIPTGYLISLLQDLYLPEARRLVSFDPGAARCGVLPGAQPFDGAILDELSPSVLCLLGAAWVQQDYVHRVLTLKRQFGTRFVMMVHDLIPIYARETCDQDTVRVFEQFMWRALRHVDHVLTVSENTARDVRRYVGTLGIPEPPITVTRNGSSFDEFLPQAAQAKRRTLRHLPERFVLCVATIEGRKNHQLILDVWRRMLSEGADPPHLICVGRLGWKASAFINPLVETNYLGGRVHLLRDISDLELRELYDRCLFTVYPTLYEGWGLPVGEALSLGKICVCSDRTSMPEVAGDLGVYLNVDDVKGSLSVLRGLIDDERSRSELEGRIRREFVPITWKSVAERVVAGCEASAAIEWQEPYPYIALPYSTEIGFGQLDRHIDGIGEPLLAQIIDVRKGHFRHDLLGERNFLIGEEIRSGGAWAPPESWGAWLCRSGGDIEFALALEPILHYYVFLRIRASRWLHDQPVQLLASGINVWAGRLGTEPHDIMFRITRPSDANCWWKLQICAEVEVSPENTSRIAAEDSRIPAIGFERLVVVPDNDIKARLDIMTKLLVRSSII